MTDTNPDEPQPYAFDLIRDVAPDGVSVKTEMQRMLEGFEKQMEEEN